MTLADLSESLLAKACLEVESLPLETELACVDVKCRLFIADVSVLSKNLLAGAEDVGDRGVAHVSCVGCRRGSRRRRLGDGDQVVAVVEVLVDDVPDLSRDCQETTWWCVSCHGG